VSLWASLPEGTSLSAIGSTEPNNVTNPHGIPASRADDCPHNASDLAGGDDEDAGARVYFTDLAHPCTVILVRKG
jgi:hypothetical protein